MVARMKSAAHIETTESHVAVFSRVAWISAFAVLTGLAAWVKIPLPFTPIPVTLQTAVVLAGGVILGRDGMYAQLLYLLLGGIGLPWFAGETGHLVYVFGASGGYLIGFVAAAAIAGRWLHPAWGTLSYRARVVRLLLTSLVIFVPGVLQLKLVLGISLAKALALGFLPFVAGDVLKTLAISALPSRVVR
jgi:biotin transport system substrate-specific component